MTSYPADFEEHIRQLLSHLYDYLKLVENPVARRLAGEHSGKERMQAIRSAVMQAIENLRRENTANPASRQNRLYNILMLRYIDERSANEVLNRLALSERQYYREHQRALQTISQVIWDQRFSPEAERGKHSLARELSYLNLEGDPKSFAAHAEIAAALRSTGALAKQRGIQIQLSQPAAPIQLQAAQPVFRQLVIYLLNSMLGGLEAGAQIRISVDPAPAIIFSAASLDDAWQNLHADATANALLRSLNAQLESQSPPSSIRLSFAQSAPKILIVDDNPDSIALFKRYLANLPYQLLTAQEESQAMRIARDMPPLCVILDVMLPGVDGWQILQRLKSHPDTADIPVLICSVLEMQDLALSLGADGYLKKPPARDELLRLLQSAQISQL